MDGKSGRALHPEDSIRSVVGFFMARHRDRYPDTGPYKLTPAGAWAVSHPETVAAFFQRLDLGRFRLFCDLGSGDGLVVCLAALFTRAVGIEADRELCLEARKNALELGLGHRAEFVCGDFRRLRFHRADCLYIYPDKPQLSFFEPPPGWSGIFLVMGPHFPPHGFVPVHRWKWKTETLTVYEPVKTP